MDGIRLRNMMGYIMPPTDDPNEITENASGLRFPTEVDIR